MAEIKEERTYSAQEWYKWTLTYHKQYEHEMRSSQKNEFKLMKKKKKKFNQLYVIQEGLIRDARFFYNAPVIHFGIKRKRHAFLLSQYSVCWARYFKCSNIIIYVVCSWHLNCQISTETVRKIVICLWQYLYCILNFTQYYNNLSIYCSIINWNFIWNIELNNSVFDN